jgi:hypothetical protein
MHITAFVFIDDDERGLHADYDKWLEKLAPHEPVSSYRHNRTGEDNADAHMKRQIMGREVAVAITAGKLDFGPWEQIFYGEFDGGRRKRDPRDEPPLALKEKVGRGELGLKTGKGFYTRTTPDSLSAARDFVRSVACVPLPVQKEILGFCFNSVWRAV